MKVENDTLFQLSVALGVYDGRLTAKQQYSAALQAICDYQRITMDACAVLDSRDDNEPQDRAGATSVDVNTIIHLAASVSKVKPERGNR